MGDSILCCGQFIWPEIKLFSMSTGDRTKGPGLKLQQGGFRLDIMINSLIGRIMRYNK